VIAQSLSRIFVWLQCASIIVIGNVCFVFAEPSTDLPPDDLYSPSGIHILDGSCYLDVGELHVNITNHGLIGSQFSRTSTYSDAPSAQWPGGSGNEYLFGAGLWVGGKVGGVFCVSTGQYEREFRPGRESSDTIYEAKVGKIIRPFANENPTGRRMPDAYSDDDRDGKYDEDFLNGKDDDNDGLIDEDFAQLGDQMFTCTMYDNLPLISEIYPEHRPMGLKVVQRAIAWNREYQENIVGLDFEISNVGYETIDDVYLGFLVDCDIQRRSDGPNVPDDLAGYYSGSVRADNGIYYRADIAYMRDGNLNDPLPGYFGVMLIDHNTEFYGTHAPFHPAINSFQIFAANASVNQDGEPLSDEDRYYLMARNQYDSNTHPDDANDLKFMISSGPFATLEPGMTLKYRLALIIGDGFDDMLRTAVEAGRLGAGRWHNMDNYYYTGLYGRETEVCLGDYPSWFSGTDPIMGHRINFMNEECAGSEPVMYQDVIWDGNLTPGPTGDLCIWVNLDNCEECFRARGYDCTPDNFLSTYMGHTRTGTYGRETHFPWSGYRDNPPPAPSFRLVPGDRSVELFWGSQSEHSPDLGHGIIDFESYQVWRANSWTRPHGTPAETSPPIEMWSMVAEYDLVNFIDPIVSNSQLPLTLGRNTGLDEIEYTPACLSEDRFEGLAEEMQLVVDADIQNRWKFRPHLRNHDGSVVGGMEGLIRWESYPTVLDTFFAVAYRQATPTVVGKWSETFYHYTDTNIPNGFDTYYSVTASDHSLTLFNNNYYPSGYGTSEKPANYFKLTIPRTNAQTEAQRQKDGLNIYVYPNPATRKSLDEYMAQSPNNDNPSGVRVTWNNLPLANNTIHIFTIAGDLVKTLNHDGFNEGGSTSWNLVSHNGQQVTSGIYLYVVQSNNGNFADVSGKFVVVR